MDIFFGCFSAWNNGLEKQCIAISHKRDEVCVIIPFDTEHLLMSVFVLIWMIHDIEESSVVYSGENCFKRNITFLF